MLGHGVPGWDGWPAMRRRAAVAAVLDGARCWLDGLPAGLRASGPRDAARALGLEVEIREGDPASGLRACWYPGERRIVVFAWSLAEVEARAPEVDALGLHVAHELFHVLHPRRRLVLALPDPCAGGGIRRVRSRMAVEVAAHAFSAAWAAWRWFPGGFDALAAVRRGIWDAAQVLRLIRQARAHRQEPFALPPKDGREEVHG